MMRTIMQLRSRLEALPAIVALAGALSTASAWGADLRPSVTVNDSVVRLGDVVDGAEKAATVIIADAPLPGTSTQLPISLIQQVAVEYGVDLSINVVGRSIEVERAGHAVSQDDLTARLAQAFPTSQGRLRLRLHRNSGRLFLPAGFDVSEIAVLDLQFDERTGRFSALIALPLGQGKMSEHDVSGIAETIMSIPVLKTVVDRGEIISRHDIGWIDVQSSRLGSQVITTADELIGQSPRRRLRTDQPVRTSDITAPILVEKGAVVTMVVETGNMTLTAMGKALQNGAEGDVIRVLNTDTHRSIEGLVTSSGEISIRLNTRRDTAALNK